MMTNDFEVTNVQVSGKNLVVTPSLDQYVRSKLSKIEHILRNITKIHVILSVDKLDQKAEADIHIGGNTNNLFATATTGDMYKSIDELEHKLLNQARRYHDKLVEHRAQREEPEDTF